MSQEGAILIDGKAISKEVLENVADELARIREVENAFRPGLAIVQVLCIYCLCSKVGIS